MSDFISNLFRKDIAYDVLLENKEYIKYWTAKKQAEKELEKLMSPEAQNWFKKYVEAEIGLQDMEFNEQFEIGFRKGARFTYEAFYNKKYSK